MPGAAAHRSFQTALSLGQKWMLLASLLAGCGSVPKTSLPDRIIASNHRDWAPMFRVLPHAEIEGEQITLKNIRNFQYLTEDDYLVQYYDRTFQVGDIQSVDFIMVPFQGMETIAHTMLSFGLVDGTYIGVSVEVRMEKGEHYSTSLGVSNQFEITYVVADERDIIRLRTRYRDADVYVYPSTATPAAAQQLFLDMMRRVNALYVKPEFYDTLRNNCTTNLVRHVNRVFPQRVPFAWPVILSGHSDEFAYRLGLLDNSVPFEQLKAAAYINDLAEKYFDDPDFSQRIRSRRAALPAADSATKSTDAVDSEFLPPGESTFQD